MALAPTSLRCFLTGRPLCTVTVPQLTKSRPSRLSCKASNEKDTLPSRGNLAVKLGKLAMVALAAGVLSLGSVDDAMAAKSGGRVGGKAFRPAPPPRSSGPRINNSRCKGEQLEESWKKHEVDPDLTMLLSCFNKLRSKNSSPGC